VIQVHADFPSRFLPQARPIAVHVPPNYDTDSSGRYPVLYLQDGQNLFDPATAFGGVPWRCDETADRVAAEGRCRPVILVGVGNTSDRLREYGPRKAPHPDDLSREYARFLVEELKPFMDATYRSLHGPDATGVGGSSMGGLIALHLARWHPEVFGRCAAISPSLWWDNETFARSPDWPPGVRLWLDMGGREGATPAAMRANVRRARRLADKLRRFPEFRYAEFPDAGHSEADWGARFDRVLEYLFPPER
jgi:predicted alpha/beta superfamily hydrolase